LPLLAASTASLPAPPCIVTATLAAGCLEPGVCYRQAEHGSCRLAVLTAQDHKALQYTTARNCNLLRPRHHELWLRSAPASGPYASCWTGFGRVLLAVSHHAPDHADKQTHMTGSLSCAARKLDLPGAYTGVGASVGFNSILPEAGTDRAPGGNAPNMLGSGFEWSKSCCILRRATKSVSHVRRATTS